MSETLGGPNACFCQFLNVVQAFLVSAFFVPPFLVPSFLVAQLFSLTSSLSIAGCCDIMAVVADVDAHVVKGATHLAEVRSEN